MIITRAPLRVSFAGGGTDLPQFYENFGFGAVVSTAINRFMYVTLNEKFDGKISIRYRIHENCDSVREIKHSLIRECLLHYGIESGIEIVIASEVPARGSGLGASSSLAVALCLALEKYLGRHSRKTEIAEIASMIEISKCNSPIGKQDHYASALGGLNFLKFSKDKVERYQFPRTEFVDELEEQSMLFYLSIEHEYKDSSGGHFVQKILKDQSGSVHANRNLYELHRHNACELWDNMKYEVIERFMDHVNENWRLKRQFHQDISNPKIDAVIERAYSAGATAAKVCGAGGGGFLYLMVPPSMQDNVRTTLSELSELRFKFNETGAEVIFHDKENYVYA